MNWSSLNTISKDIAISKPVYVQLKLLRAINFIATLMVPFYFGERRQVVRREAAAPILSIHG